MSYKHIMLSEQIKQLQSEINYYQDLIAEKRAHLITLQATLKQSKP